MKKKKGMLRMKEILMELKSDRFEGKAKKKCKGRKWWKKGSKMKKSEENKKNVMKKGKLMSGWMNINEKKVNNLENNKLKRKNKW